MTPTFLSEYEEQFNYLNNNTDFRPPPVVSFPLARTWLCSFRRSGNLSFCVASPLAAFPPMGRRTALLFFSFFFGFTPLSWRRADAFFLLGLVPVPLFSPRSRGLTIYPQTFPIGLITLSFFSAANSLPFFFFLLFSIPPGPLPRLPRDPERSLFPPLFFFLLLLSLFFFCDVFFLGPIIRRGQVPITSLSTPLPPSPVSPALLRPFFLEDGPPSRAHPLFTAQARILTLPSSSSQGSSFDET